MERSVDVGWREIVAHIALLLGAAPVATVFLIGALARTVLAQ